jgi:hypothetical protein
MKTLRCYNLTDVETADLKSRNLFQIPLIVRTAIISPGGFVDLPDDDATRREAKCFVDLGALAIDILPPAYVLARGREIKEKQVLPKIRAPLRRKAR